MARKKTRLKKTTTSVNSVEKMEKDFRDMPAKIVAQYRKELSVVSQQQNKIQTELKKAHVLQKTLKNKHASPSSQKMTPALKKKLAAGKKIETQLTKSIKEFTAQSEQLRKIAAAFTAKQAIFTSMGKELVKLEKQLANKAKESKQARKIKSTKPRTQESVRLEPAKPNEMVEVAEFETTELTSQ